MAAAAAAVSDESADAPPPGPDASLADNDAASEQIMACDGERGCGVDRRDVEIEKMSAEHR